MSDVQTNNFTPRTQQVLALARKEAGRYHQTSVGTEHLLLGLIKLGHGVAIEVLQTIGVNLETVRTTLEALAGTAPGRTDAETITLCDLTGTGVQDTAITTLAHARAVARGAGQAFDS